MISAGTREVKLYTSAELAEIFGVEERTFLTWRRENGWPSVRVGRTIRFTQAQVDEILERHSQKPAAGSVDDTVTAIPGQSKASAARKKAS